MLLPPNHAEYTAFSRGFTSKWSFIYRTAKDPTRLFFPIIILHALLGRPPTCDDERPLLALPARCSCFDIFDPIKYYLCSIRSQGNSLNFQMMSVQRCNVIVFLPYDQPHFSCNDIVTIGPRVLMSSRYLQAVLTSQQMQHHLHPG